MPPPRRRRRDRSTSPRAASETRHHPEPESFRIGAHPGKRAFRLGTILRDAFLPEGYPDSVSSDYGAYQLWDTLQCYCSSISGQLSTQAVLKGVGVGNEAASPLAAALTWTLRDGAGMLGRIVFAWAKASSLDRDARFWRLAADVLNDVALLLDILSPAFPDVFLLLICVSSVLKAIVGVAGGATRMVLTQHQARNHNHADVAAKDGSQETAVNLAALVTGLVLLPAVHGHPAWVWAIFLTATAGHVYSNYRAVKAVVMETFDVQRLAIVAELLRSHPVGVVPLELVTPAAVAQRERLYHRSAGVRVGVALADLGASPSELDDIVRVNAGRPYLVAPLDPGTRGARRCRVAVVLSERAEVPDVIEACLVALSVPLASSSRAASLRDLAAVYERLGAPGQLCQRLAAAGWKLHTVAVPIEEWRARW